MLSKNLCKKCVGLSWNDGCDNFWNSGRVLLCKHSKGVQYTYKKPPNECPFILEHLFKHLEKK